VLTCRAYDAAGNNTTSAGVNVTTVPLMIAFSSPGIGEAVSVTTNLSVSIQSNAAVARVDYTVSPAFIKGVGDEVPIGTTTTPPFNMAWDTTQFADGPYVLSATAYDVNGHPATAQTYVDVVNDPCGSGPSPDGIGLNIVICPGWEL
jgi:hypothetical protein